MLRPPLATALATLLVASCASDGEGPDETPLAPPEERQGFQMTASAVAPAGSEIWMCVVYDIPTDRWEMVNRVESVQNTGMHHMSITALTLTNVDLEPATYDCNELYDQYPQLMDATVIYGAQAEEQEIVLPEGVGANLIPSMRVMHEIHFVNLADEDVMAESYVNAYFAPEGTTQDTIWGGVTRDLELNIPPFSEHEEWSRCVMNADVEVLFMSSHTHELGKEVQIRRFDGEEVDDLVYVNTDWHAPLLEDFTAEPLSIKKGEGFEFKCVYDNPTDSFITYGDSSKDEMCSMTLVFTPGVGTHTCETIETSDGVL